jgi:hypothetical protein
MLADEHKDSRLSRPGKFLLGGLCLAGAGTISLLALFGPRGFLVSAPAEARAPLPASAGPRLEPSAWVAVSSGEFEERSAEVVGSRIRLKSATRGTRSDEVKIVGLRSREKISWTDALRIEVNVDWNEQTNGSTLSAMLVLSPTQTDGNPLEAPDWIKVEYVGVPPGKQGRLVVARRSAGADENPFLEGWPQKNPEGRPLTVQRVGLSLSAGGYQVRENGAQKFSSEGGRPTFTSGYLYLLMSTHSNYPSRELFFDHLRVSR